MYVAILAGGSGTRLWPLSREQFPKQYLALSEDGRSLFQETVARVLPVVPAEKIIVVTHQGQKEEIRRQLALIGLGDGITLFGEPCARNTAPAIGLAARYLCSVVGPESIMAVLPSDHLIPSREQFAKLLRQGEQAAEQYGLVTFGIHPSYPETGYGYIRLGERLQEGVHRVERFVEKPDLSRACRYLQEGGYLWNSGMFVFKTGVLIGEYGRHLPVIAAALDGLEPPGMAGLDAAYEAMESISIDYGILEKVSQVTVIPTGIGWSDVGSWEAFYQISEKDEAGNFLQGDVLAREVKNSLVLSRSRLVGAAGLDGLVVVDTPDALLVCSREKSQEVKHLVDELRNRRSPECLHHRTVHRPWGSFTTLDKGETYQVKRITVNPGARLSLQSHRLRSEHWVVVRGTASVTVDDTERRLKKGESVFIPVGGIHRLHNTGTDLLEVIEVQNGDYLGEDDIRRFEDDFDRAGPGQSYREWLECPELDHLTRRELLEMKGDARLVKEHFGAELVFGTGGMRGVIGPGLNRMNIYIVRRATQGLANYINAPGGNGELKKVVIAYDNRRYSREFALEAALVLAANGIKALLFDGIRPTPQLSFATRHLGCAAGIVITASHNPPEYNGYKVYGPDGGQAVSPFIDRLVEEIAAVHLFRDVRTVTEPEAVERGLLESIGPAVDSLFLDAVRSLSLSSPRERLKVVYTPLHGTGACFIPGLLRETGYIDLALVEEQMDPDPDFGTVASPNPEDHASFEMALAMARRTGADLVLATDPDGDRVGCAVREAGGGYVHLSGNQTGALLLAYILERLSERGELPPGGAMVKTIVTGNLGRKVADAYGVTTEETLTGFKFIGERIREYEESGERSFIFGYEESYGYLAGTFARDKDAVGVTFLLAEMGAYYKEKGLSLLQVLERLSSRYGYFREALVSLKLKDMTEADGLMKAFYEIPPELAGVAVVERRDYEKSKARELPGGKEYDLTLPRSKVLYYRMADGSWFCIRPSGTEPKVKIYFSVDAAAAAEAEAKLERLKKAVLALSGR